MVSQSVPAFGLARRIAAVALIALSFGSAVDAATYQWVARGDASNVFTEANWTDVSTGATPAAGTMDPGVASVHVLVVNGLTPGGGSGTAGNLAFSNGGGLVVNEGVFRLAAASSVIGGTVSVNGGVAYAGSLDGGVQVSIAAGRLELSSGQPLVSGAGVSFVATSTGLIRFTSVAPEMVRTNFLSAITVNGVAAQENINLLVWSDGAAGTYIRRYDSNDTDGDGLLDTWEQQYFGNLSQTATGDPDGDGVQNRFEFAGGTAPNVGGGSDALGLIGSLRREVWTGISGTAVSNLTGSSSFKSTPQQVTLVGVAESPTNTADNYGQRLRGWIKAPVTGTYKFWISGDDSCELWLGTSQSRFTRKLLCSVSGWTAPREWNRYSSQVSTVVSLQAGQEYYVEALEKEGGGSDCLAVAWEYTETATGSLTERQLISGSVLRSWSPDPLDVDDDGLPDSWEVAQGLNPASALDGAYVDSDLDGFINFDEYLTNGLALAKGGNVGYCRWETFWLSNSTGKLVDLTGNLKFAQLPDSSGYFTAGIEADRNAGDKFGRRIRGVITAPQAGSYTFYLAADDAAELWLNTSGTSRFGKRRVASLSAWTGYREFTKYTSQKSTAVSLVAGQQIYFEALYVEGAGADNCSVAWTRPGQTALEIVPASAVSLCRDEALQVGGQWVNNDLDNDSLPDNWEAQYGLSVTNSGTVAQDHGEYGDPDGDGYNNFEEWIAGTNPMVPSGIPGTLRREVWNGISSMSVSAMLGASGVLRAADNVSLCAGVEPPQNVADNYGQRLRGMLTAPATGAYTFWIAGDDNCELWLSSDNRKFHKERICGIRAINGNWGYSTFRQWDKMAGQKSAPVWLEAGHKYFFEILHKESAGSDHVSVAWQVPGSSRIVIPASALESFAKDAGDLDDDYLPDSWEIEYGLSATDNGKSNSGNGEYGDPDADGLTNRDEYLLGTDPLLPDTDGDGFADGTEYFYLHSDPLVQDVSAQTVVGTVAADAVVASSGTWSSAGDGSVFSTQMRGWMDYTFTIDQPGIYIFEIVGRARGAMIQAREDFPLELKIDGKSLGRSVLTSINGGAGTMVGMTQYLSAGQHSLRVENHNLLARRVLQLDQARILAPTGADSNEDGTVDWVADWLVNENAVTVAAEQSLTSPICIEGNATRWEMAEVEIAGLTYPAKQGVNRQWYLNASLSPVGSTAITVRYENGASEEQLCVEWVPCNVAAISNLTVRQNDRVKLTAYIPGGAATNQPVSIRIDGGTPVEILDIDTFECGFEQSGTHTVEAVYKQADGSNATATMQVDVIYANFGQPISVYCGRPREWLTQNVRNNVFVQADSRISTSELPAPPPPAESRKFLVDVSTPDSCKILARTAENGPIVTAGTVNGMLVSHTSSVEGATVIQTLSNGDRVVEMTVAITSLPPGGYIKMEIWLGGRLFEDGTTVKILRAEDFDANGLARVRFILSGTIGSTCHRTYVYDAQGMLVGQM